MFVNTQIKISSSQDRRYHFLNGEMMRILWNYGAALFPPCFALIFSEFKHYALLWMQISVSLSANLVPYGYSENFLRLLLLGYCLLWLLEGRRIGLLLVVFLLFWSLNQTKSDILLLFGLQLFDLLQQWFLRFLQYLYYWLQWVYGFILLFR